MASRASHVISISNESLGALIKFQIRRTKGHDFLLKIQEMFLHFFAQTILAGIPKSVVHHYQLFRTLGSMA